MAGYKNGVNSFGVMSVGKDDTSSDIQTGRAVYVDDDKYLKDSSYRNRVDKYVAEGFHRIGDAGTHSNGGGIFPVKISHREVDSNNRTRSYYDRTWRDVYNAVLNNSYPCIVMFAQDGVSLLPLLCVDLEDYDGSGYMHVAKFSEYEHSGTALLIADSADGYLYVDEHFS